MHTRQQNFQFAYCYVPALLFRSDFAAMLARFYPAGFGYLEAAWKRLAEFYPPEHVVGEDGFEVASFTISSGVLAILVTMPPAERDLEVTHLVIVIQPQLSYFTVGNSLDQTRTLRSVDARMVIQLVPPIVRLGATQQQLAAFSIRSRFVVQSREAGDRL